MIKRALLTATCCLALFGMVWQFGQTSAEPLNLPPGFVVTEYGKAGTFISAIERMPNGHFLALKKGLSESTDARVNLLVDGVVQETPVILINTDGSGNSGLTSLVLDPNFESNGWFYIYYAPGSQALDYSGEKSFRLSRFTYDPASRTAKPESETIIIDHITWDLFHNGAALEFDQFGNLIIGYGDRSSDTASQDYAQTDAGKIWRITPLPEGGYSIPADNPFVSDPEIADEIYASGVRNPFRMVKRESDNLMLFGDVGGTKWEEVNVLESGANYGWIIREGPCEAHRYEPCSATPPEFTDPIITYRHDEDLSLGSNGAITALAFYEGDEFPEAYRNKLFFADFNQGFIAYADVDDPDGLTIFSPNFFINGTIDLISADGGLYLINTYTGKIFFISYPAGMNQVPSASFTVDRTYSDGSLPIQFDARQSSDPDGTELTYHWDFGDGMTQTTTTPLASHTYTQDGSYPVSLLVRDIEGAPSIKDESTVYIYSGEFPTIELTVTNAPTRTQWHGGDVIAYTAVLSDYGRLDPVSPFEWQIELHHNEHSHAQVGGVKAVSGNYQITADNHGGDWNLWYRFYVTMKTETGQEILIYEEIQAQLTDITVKTSLDESNAEININGGQQITPYQFRVISGVDQLFLAPPTILNGHDVERLFEWTSAPLSTVPITPTQAITLSIQAPTEPVTYTANYLFDRPADLSFMPTIIK